MGADEPLTQSGKTLAAFDNNPPVVGYKLIKAGVTVQPVGAGHAVRTADIRTFVRVTIA